MSALITVELDLVHRSVGTTHSFKKSLRSREGIAWDQKVDKHSGVTHIEVRSFRYMSRCRDITGMGTPHRPRTRFMLSNACGNRMVGDQHYMHPSHHALIEPKSTAGSCLLISHH
jgi:hypothetical protein